MMAMTLPAEFLCALHILSDFLDFPAGLKTLAYCPLWQESVIRGPWSQEFVHCVLRIVQCSSAANHGQQVESTVLDFGML